MDAPKQALQTMGLIVIGIIGAVVIGVLILVVGVQLASSRCPVLVIEGPANANGRTASTSNTWSELQKQWTEEEPTTNDIGELCSRDRNNRVQVFLGWSPGSNRLADKGRMYRGQAVQLIQANPGEPAIVVPW